MAIRTAFLYTVTTPMEWEAAGFRPNGDEGLPAEFGNGFMPVFASYDEARRLHPDAVIEEIRGYVPDEDDAPEVDVEEVAEEADAL